MRQLARFWKRSGSDRPPPLRDQGGKRSAIPLPLPVFLLGLALLPSNPAGAGIAVPYSSANDPLLAAQAGGERAWPASEILSPLDCLQVERNGLVSYHLNLYQTKKRGSLLRDFRNAEAYLAQVKADFERAGLPGELSNLAFPESGFNPFAYSRAGAAGIWQLMEPTARLLGLQVNWWVDERRDPEKSTRVAARYLKELYRVFGSWPLAIAAYNAGEAKVLGALRKRPRADIWSLRLPKETRHLVSAFMAVTLILQGPEDYSFPAILEDSPSYVKVSLDSCTDLRVIARACDVSPQEILELNPELNWGCTPPDRNGYEIRIPLMAAHRFEEALSLIPPDERIVWTRHQVRKGDTLFGISRHYRVPMPIIARMNRLGSFHSLRVGKELLLPIPQGFRRWAKERVRFSQRWAIASFPFESHRTYRVRKGDTLEAIARQHGIPVKYLQQVNGLRSGAVLRPGARLRVPKARIL